MEAQIATGVYDGPVLGVGVVCLTLPTVLLCAIAATVLAGFRRSKLAWISLSVYFLPLVFCSRTDFGKPLRNVYDSRSRPFDRGRV
jgi:hypothetical protein